MSSLKKIKTDYTSEAKRNRRNGSSADDITVDVESARLKKMPAAHPQFFTTIRF